MEVTMVVRDVVLDSSEVVVMDGEDVVVSVWEVVDATDVVVVEGGREDVEVTVSAEDVVDGGADVVENVELDVDDVEMVEVLLLLLLVVLQNCEPDSGQKVCQRRT